MKICVVACTWFRPLQLGQLIKCFLEQDYPAELAEMVILDDAGQYENARGDRWQLVSIPRRFKTLGEKRNATIALVSDDVQAVCIWDDDDLYLPWHLRASAAALERAPWSRPSNVLYEQPDRLTPHRTSGLYQGGWAFRLEKSDGLTGKSLPAGLSYSATSINEDQVLIGALTRAGVTSADPLAQGFAPSYIYRDASSASYHASYMGAVDEAWRVLARESHWNWTQAPLSRADLNEIARAGGQADWIHLPRDYRNLPIEGFS